MFCNVFGCESGSIISTKSKRKCMALCNVILGKCIRAGALLLSIDELLNVCL
jgi:hypothetical protein